MRSPSETRRAARLQSPARSPIARLSQIDLDESPLVGQAEMPRRSGNFGGNDADNDSDANDSQNTRAAFPESGPSAPPPDEGLNSRPKTLMSRGPKRPLGAESYDLIDFDQISDPFTDTRRAFMRGNAPAPPPPRQVPRAPFTPADTKGKSPEPSPARSPARSPKRPPQLAEPQKRHASPRRASPVRHSSPLGVRRSPVRELGSPVRSQASPQRRASPRRPSPPRQPVEKAPEPEAAPDEQSLTLSDVLAQGAPQRSNRVLTQELLTWKQKYAALSDQLETLQNSADSGENRSAAWASDISALERQVVELERGRDRDRRAMRQRVRVLETHMADAKIQYDNRYWQLLTSSPGTDEAAVELVSTRNELTRLQGTEADLRRRLRETQDQASFLIALYKWRAQMAGNDDVQRISELEQRLEAETNARAEAERGRQDAERALALAERALALAEQRQPAPPAPVVNEEPVPIVSEMEQIAVPSSPRPALVPDPPQEGSISPPDADYELPERDEEAPQALPELDTEPTRPASRASDAATPGPRPRGRPRKRPDPSTGSAGLEYFGIAPRESTSSATSEVAPLPGATPMVPRTDLGEGTPMLDGGSPTRKKKRKLLGKGGGILRLAEGTSGLAQELNLPTELSPIKPGAGMGMYGL